jgi:spore germination protein GerM
VIRRTVLIAAGILVVAIAGCGIPDSSGFRPVNRDDIPFDLAETTTTTTTLPPTTTIESTSTTAAIETSTTISTEPVELYFVSGSQLTPVSIALASPTTPSQVMAALLDGPPSGDLGIGLRSVIPRGADITVGESAGVAEVDLPNGIFDTLTATDQRLLFGQIVLTMTRRPGIGQVRFTLDGEPTEVFTGSGDVRAPGETVSSDDYRELTTGAAPTTTSTTTTTTAPPSIAPAAATVVDTVPATSGG